MSLERAMKRQVVFNERTRQYGVLMEDGKVEITSYETEPGDIWPTRSYLGPRVKITGDWKVLGGAGGAEGG